METRSCSKRVTRQSSRNRRPSGRLRTSAQLEALPKAKPRKPSRVLKASCSHKALVAKSATVSIQAANPKSSPNPELLIKKQQDRLNKLDKELEQRTADLAHLRASISNKEQEDEARRRKQTLEFLEEHFTCALWVIHDHLNRSS